MHPRANAARDAKSLRAAFPGLSFPAFASGPRQWWPLVSLPLQADRAQLTDVPVGRFSLPWLPNPADYLREYSTFWRVHLTANFAIGILFCMDVDVPLTGGELLRLLGRQCGLAFDGTRGHRALLC